MRREKSLRIGVHHANGVVWGPVYRTHLNRGFPARLQRVGNDPEEPGEVLVPHRLDHLDGDHLIVRRPLVRAEMIAVVLEDDGHAVRDAGGGDASRRLRELGGVERRQKRS